MNTTLSTRVDEQSYQHQPQHTHTVRRVGLADRVALHVGLALVTWSRRPLVLADEPSWTERLTRHENHVARDQREQQWVRALNLSQSRR